MTLQQFVLRIFIVIVIGFIIGVERQITGHTTGLKTTVLIALGTFSFVSLEVLINTNDVRMAANIITGIGFLCSGVIFKNGFTVNGLNTSATLWTTAGISVLAGYGFIYYAIAATVILVLFNLLLPFFCKYIKPISLFLDASNEDVFYINIVCLKSDVVNIKKIINDNLTDKITLESIQTSGITPDKYRVKAKFLSNNNHTDEISNITDKIFETNVLSVAWEKDSE